LNDLFSYGLSLGAEKEVVKDAIQDIFLNIYFNKKEFESVNHFKYSLFRSLKNRLYNIYKSKAVSKSEGLSDEFMNFPVTTTVLDEIIDEEEQKNIKKQVDSLLSKLTARQREVIYLRYMQNLEYEQIGKMMDITPHAARKLVSRSLKKMRDDDLMGVFLSFLLNFPI
jgi:RNA polymerase sigma factor (sigma-70 family)